MHLGGNNKAQFMLCTVVELSYGSLIKSCYSICKGKTKLQGILSNDTRSFAFC